MPNICRICRSSKDWAKMLVPCGCSGSLSYVHYYCLIDWIDVSKSDECNVCRVRYDYSKSPITVCPSLKTYIPWILTNIKGPDGSIVFVNVALLLLISTLFFLSFVISKAEDWSDSQLFIGWNQYLITAIFVFIGLVLIFSVFINRCDYCRWKAKNQVSKKIFDIRSRVP